VIILSLSHSKIIWSSILPFSFVSIFSNDLWFTSSSFQNFHCLSLLSISLSHTHCFHYQRIQANLPIVFWKYLKSLVKALVSQVFNYYPLFFITLHFFSLFIFSLLLNSKSLYVSVISLVWLFTAFEFFSLQVRIRSLS
jgi:hypothetical protein